MVFVNSLTPPPPPQTTRLQNLCAAPHRLFFFAGVVQGLLFIALLGLQYIGGVSVHVSLGLYHAYALSFIIFTQFFAGFLLTTFPRYLSRPSPSLETYMPIAGLINGGGLLFLGFCFVSELALIAPMLLILAGYARLCWVLLQMQRSTKVTQKNDTTWMLRAFAFGLLGHLLFIAHLFLPLFAWAVGISFYLYLFLLILIVSQKMVPFFAANAIQGYQIRKSSYFLSLMCAGLIAKVILEALDINALVANAALLAIIVYELLLWRLPFRKAPAILAVLFLSLWWIPVGFLLSTLHDLMALLGMPIFVEKAPLHALALGYFTTILLGFGTRVILGHSGRTPKADRYTITLFGLIQVMTLLRLFVALFPQLGYVHGIVSAGVLWIVIFGMWAKRYLPILYEK